MSKKILGQALVVLMVLFTLLLATRPLKNPYESYSDLEESFVFSTGNATQDDRAEIIRQLKTFQDGYETRDTNSVSSFMQGLFSPTDVLILGTMPREVYVGFDEASTLIFNDWASWGDCTFLVDKARISVHEDVAWFATIGYVEFDLTSLLVLPLRLTGVMVREDHTWKLHQLQYQFDLDLGFYLLSIIVLAALLVVSVGFLVVVILRGALHSKSASRHQGM